MNTTCDVPPSSISTKTPPEVQTSLAQSETPGYLLPVPLPPSRILARTLTYILVSTRSIESGTSCPGVTPVTRVYRSASVPNLSMVSMGSTTFPFVLLIFMPLLSFTSPEREREREGVHVHGLSSIVKWSSQRA